MRAGSGNCAVVGCSGCAGGKPCREGGWPCHEGVKPYLEGVGSCGEGGGDPKAARMFSNGSIHSGPPALWRPHFHENGRRLRRHAVFFRLHQDFSGPFLVENVEKVSIGDIHQHGA